MRDKIKNLMSTCFEDNEGNYHSTVDIRVGENEYETLYLQPELEELLSKNVSKYKVGITSARGRSTVAAAWVNAFGEVEVYTAFLEE